MAIDIALLNGIPASSLSSNTLLAELASLNSTTGVMDLASGPLLVVLDQQSASYQVEISDLGTLLSDLTALQDAATPLAGSAALSISANSSDPSVVTATAGDTATPGFYSVQVDQVAQAQVLMSAGLGGSTTAIGSGAPTTLTFQFGTTTGDSFIPNPGQLAQTVAIGTGNNTLQGIAAAINAANIGVNAFVIQDAAGYHLQVAAADTGAASSLSIGVSGDAALAGLLTYSPGGLRAMTQLVTPQDARFTVNGLPGTSSSNTVNDPTTGLTLNLIHTGSATVSVASDGASMASKVEAFVSAFNKLQSDLTALGNGDLKGNPLVQALQKKLRNILQGSTFNLASAGLTARPDGSLALDKTALQNAVATNPSSLAVLFSNDGHGLADQLASLGQRYVNPKTGVLTTEISSLTRGLKTLQSAGESTFLQAQFFALSNLLLSLQGTNQLLAGQLGITTGLAGLQNLIALETQNPALFSLLSTG